MSSVPSPVPALVARGEGVSLRSRRLERTDVDACHRARLLGPLAEQISVHGLELTPAAADRLRAGRLREAQDAVALDSRCLATSNHLATRGIDTIVLKGAAVSRLDYARPDLRRYGDIDLLVRERDIRAAVAALEEHGFHRHYPEPFTGHDELVGKGVALGMAHGIVLDLHRTLALGYYGTRLVPDRLWEHTVPLDLAGTPLRALPRTERFVHAALHGDLSPTRRLIDSVDLVTIAADPAEVIERAEDWGCGAPVARSVMRAENSLPGRLQNDLVEWARSRRRRPVEVVVDPAYHGRLAGSRRRSATAVLGMRSWSGRAKATRGLAASTLRRRAE